MSFGGFQPTAGTGLFGANKPTTGFGGLSTTPASTPSFGFGTTPAAGSTGTTFGSPSATGFGQPAPAFGLPTNPSGLQLGAPSAGVSFGVTTTTSSTTPGFSFSTPAASTTPSLFGTTTPSFGAPTAAPTLGGFGTATSAAPSTGFSLGATSAAPSTGFSFGAAKTTGGLTLGTPSLSFGGATSAPTLNFGGLGAASTATTGFNLGGGGLFGAASSAAGLSTATSTTTVGLGGIDSAQSKLGLSGQGVTEPKQVKDHILPDPILQNFSDFQAFVKQQKSLSVDIAHSSSKPLKKVQEDIDAIESLLANVTSGLARNTVATEKLKTETAQGLFHADMAQRLRDAPNSLAYESGPEQYFSELIQRFETDGARLQIQVEVAERHLRSITQSSAISPQELTTAMRRLHETMVVLAAKTQSLHLATLAAKEEYCHLRHVYLKEDLPAPVKPVTSNRKPAPRSLAGPTPFSETSGLANLTVDALSMLTGATIPVSPATAPTGWLSTQTSDSNLMSSFPPTLPVDNSSFHLSKPPVGNKRNKR